MHFLFASNACSSLDNNFGIKDYQGISDQASGGRGRCLGGYYFQWAWYPGPQIVYFRN